MEITKNEVILENAFVYGNCIYTDEIDQKDLFETYFCRNFYKTKPVAELPKNLNKIYIQEPIIIHALEHAYTNIGHYFNEHLYSCVVSQLTHACKVLLHLSNDRLFVDQDVFNSKDTKNGNFYWGASIFKSLGLEILKQDLTIGYQVKKLILPREDRWISCKDINNIDPLLYIRAKAIDTVAPILDPHDVLFFNKKSDRNIINDKETIAYLEQQKLSYKVIESFRDLSFAEVLTLFYNAKTVIAPWGSHLTNVLFMKPGCTVYELHPSNMRDSWWRRMGNIYKERCDINYVAMPCKYIEDENKKRENTKVVVEIYDI